MQEYLGDGFSFWEDVVGQEEGRLSTDGGNERECRIRPQLRILQTVVFT
jgi:hypothetical protein